MKKSDDKKPSNVFRGSLFRKEQEPKFKRSEKKLKNRVAPECCADVELDYKQTLNDKYSKSLVHMKDKDLLTNVELLAPVVSPRPLHYRTHVKLAVRKSKSSERRLDIGLFKRDSHEVEHIHNCPIHRKTINWLLRDLAVELEASDITPYDEVTGEGDLRYIAIRASHLTEELMLTFVMTNENHKIALKNMVMVLRNKPHIISSVHININTENTNTIFGQSSKRILGSDRLREELCGLSFQIAPTSFFQVNPWQAENIYRRVEQIAGKSVVGGVAWDLYCGTGQISMLLAQSGFRTLGIEVNPQAIRDAQKNVVTNDISPAPHYVAGKVEEIQGDFPTWAEKPELIVVNPSRKGLSDSVRDYLKGVLRESPKVRLIYVSCEMETLARDVEDLTSEGHSMKQLEAFDMFPYTEKLEWLAVLN